MYLKFFWICFCCLFFFLVVAQGFISFMLLVFCLCAAHCSWKIICEISLRSRIRYVPPGRIFICFFQVLRDSTHLYKLLNSWLAFCLFGLLILFLSFNHPGIIDSDYVNISQGSLHLLHGQGNFIAAPWGQRKYFFWLTFSLRL